MKALIAMSGGVDSSVAAYLLKHSGWDCVGATMTLLKPAKLEEIVFCPHAPTETCDCRKPKPQLGLYLIKKYNIDTARSYMIGDKKADVEFGHNIGVKSVLVTTANGKNHLKKYPDLKPQKIASNLLNAARFIVADDGAANGK